MGPSLPDLSAATPEALAANVLLAAGVVSWGGPGVLERKGVVGCVGTTASIFFSPGLPFLSDAHSLTNHNKNTNNKIKQPHSAHL
jgi:hypothetical protein